MRLCSISWIRIASHFYLDRYIDCKVTIMFSDCDHLLISLQKTRAKEISNMQTKMLRSKMNC